MPEPTESTYPLDMSALVDFMNARVDEDEEFAAACEWKEWRCGGSEVIALATPVMRPVADGKFRGRYGADPLAEADAEHIARHDPERALREVAAKRSHITRWQKVDNLLPGSDGEVRRSLLSVRRAYALVILDDATVYADHPDYRSEWKPRADKGEDHA